MSADADGYFFFTIYRAHAVHCHNGKGVPPYQYKAKRGDVFTVFDHTFEGMRAQLDEIHGAGKTSTPEAGTG